MSSFEQETAKGPYFGVTDDFYYQLVKDLPCAVYACDANGFITFYNTAAVELWGREPEIGKDLWCGPWKIYKPDGSLIPQEEWPMAVVLKQHKAMVAEVIIATPDGR